VLAPPGAAPTAPPEQGTTPPEQGTTAPALPVVDVRGADRLSA